MAVIVVKVSLQAVSLPCRMLPAGLRTSLLAGPSPPVLLLHSVRSDHWAGNSGRELQVIT